MAADVIVSHTDARLQGVCKAAGALATSTEGGSETCSNSFSELDVASEGSYNSESVAAHASSGSCRRERGSSRDIVSEHADAADLDGDDDASDATAASPRRAELARAVAVLVPPKVAALPYPSTLVPLQSCTGLDLLEEALVGSLSDVFERLVQCFEGQGPLQCGVTSLTIALNLCGCQRSSSRFTRHDLQEKLRASLRVRYPFFSANLTELGALAECFAETRTVYAGDSDCDEFRRLAVATLKVGGAVIANFERAAVGYAASPFSGHCSPLGAYNARSDQFLVLDVACKTWQPVWVPTQLLFRGMATLDRPRDELLEFLTAVTTPWLGRDRLHVDHVPQEDNSTGVAKEDRTRGFMLLHRHT